MKCLGHETYLNGQKWQLLSPSGGFDSLVEHRPLQISNIPSQGTLLTLFLCSHYFSHHSDEVWRSLPGFSLATALLFPSPILHLIPPSAPFIVPLNCSLVFQSWLLSTSMIASRESLALAYFLSKCLGGILIFHLILTLSLWRTEKEECCFQRLF